MRRTPDPSAREAVVAAERRANQLLVDLEESRASIEQAERQHKVVESELHDAADRAGELAAANSNLNGLKRKLESDLAVLRSELDDSRTELRLAEERAKLAASNTSRLAEELRLEQVNI